MTLPPPLQKLWSGWMKFSHALGVVMSSIFLTVLWAVMFGAYAIVMKIPKLFLKTPKPASFWWDASEEVSEFHHQF